MMLIQSYTPEELSGIEEALKHYGVRTNEGGGFEVYWVNSNSSEDYYTDCVERTLNKFYGLIKDEGYDEGSIAVYCMVIFFLEIPFLDLPLFASTRSKIGQQLIAYRLKIRK